jgi:HEAT repeat protein
VKGNFRRLIILMSPMALVLATGVAFHTPARKEPEYQERPLNSWLYQMVQTKLDKNPYDHEQAAEAVRQIGPKALPNLMDLLRTEDAGAKRTVIKWAAKKKLFGVKFTPAAVSREYAAVGYEALGSVARVHIPALCEILTNHPTAHARLCAARSLGFIGVGSDGAASALLRGVRDENEWVRNDSLWALGRIQAELDLVAATLIDALDDSFPVARENAAIALGNYGPRASAAVPALRRTRSINRAAALSLARIEPDPAAGQEFSIRNRVAK